MQPAHLLNLRPPVRRIERMTDLPLPHLSPVVRSFASPASSQPRQQISLQIFRQQQCSCQIRQQ